MATGARPTTETPVSRAVRGQPVVLLVGNPNTGKTRLFNRLAGARQRVGNFAGTTSDALESTIDTPAGPVTLVDLPGVYDLAADDECSRLTAGALAGSEDAATHAVVLVLEAARLARNLDLAGDVLRRGVPTAVVLNMSDEARAAGLEVDVDALAEHLGCPVIAASAKTGEGIDATAAAIATLVRTPEAPNSTAPPGPMERRAWAVRVARGVTRRALHAGGRDRLTDAIDRVLTHRVAGPLIFAALMTGLFWSIFRLATHPMDWIDAAFASLAAAVESALPAGPLADMLANGVVAGVGATVLFLPQIVILFFLIALLEESGYLTRAAAVTDRWLRPFGLSGQAFIPLLSAHACALPAISAARGIADRRARLATILTAPFMSCTARIPVYVLLVGLLFPASALAQSGAFIAAYALGIAAALLSALVARGTLLRGRAAPFAAELPPYRLPRVSAAARIAAGRGWGFLKKAGTLILAVSIVLWWLGTYPTAGPSPAGDALRAQAAETPADADRLLADARRADTRHAAERTALGRIGSLAQPLFAPLGADERLTVGILASFAAREVFVSTMAVQVVGEETDDPESIRGSIASTQRRTGEPLFDAPTSAALLVYFVLAMQCLPTLVLTAREAGHWKWAALQLAWMFALAYAGAFAAFHLVRALGA